ncbi:MAG: PAS domain S-box protein [Humidesulfovibrio sp.]|uniref:PAS domain S-box protein n=1 Tax=Humidesulfovibrio sp. TaxID=2910988 RepID=UPI002736BE6A|nr:PAS domain S-box protein [Humidesulfovibrio sp.]MDP2846621.1 PAS domain S-box protein [Humidesulfovibrio sp.]
MSQRPDLFQPGLPLAAKIMGCLVALILGLALFLFQFNTKSFRDLAEKNADLEADRICEAIKSGASSAMMRNERGELQKIVERAGRMEGVRGVSILNKEALAMFASREDAIGVRWPVKGFQCAACHDRAIPPDTLELEERSRIEDGNAGSRRLTIFSPIANDEGCATASCHFHKPSEKVLGVLVLDMTLDKQEETLAQLVETNTVSLGVFLAGVFVLLYAVVYLLIQRPVRSIIGVTRRMAGGDLACGMSCGQAVPQRDELGELAHAIGLMCRDLGLKHAEIVNQRQLYQRLFEGVPCIITVQDRDFKLLRYNQTFADLFHARKGAYCFEAYKGRTEKCPNCPVEKTFKDGQPHFTEETGVYKDGTRAHWIVTTAPLHDEDGNVTAAMEMCLDITGRKRLEEELRKSERKYQDIFNNIPSALFVICSQNMTILDLNRSAANLYGYRRGELIGQSAEILFPPEDAQAGVLALAQGEQLGRARNQTRDGRVFFANITAAHSESDDRPVILATTTDVTERIRAERQMVQASRMATLGEMATGVAHELNQPLAVLSMAASLFQRKVERGETVDPETLRTLAGKIQSNVERGTRIINHMREFGRKPADQHAVPVDVNEVIRRAFEFFSQQLQVRGIAVTFDLAEELPPVLADPARLEQVFMNLLLNARDAIEDKCAASPCSEGDRRIILRTRARRRGVQAEVSDTGPGIPREIMSRIFEPFFTTKQVGKGTGLGLSISYGIMQDYGGAIHVRPRSGQGARFVLVFPRLGQSPPAGEADQDRSAGAGH